MSDEIVKRQNTDAGQVPNAFTYQAIGLINHIFSNPDFLKGISCFAHESKNDYRIELKTHTIFAQVKHVLKRNTSSYDDVKTGLSTLKVNSENDSKSYLDEYYYVTTGRNLFAQQGKYFLDSKTYTKDELMNNLEGINDCLKKMTDITEFSDNIFFKVLPFDGRDNTDKFKETNNLVYRTLLSLKLYSKNDKTEVENLVNKLVNKYNTAIIGTSGIEIKKMELVADILNELMRSLVCVIDYENKYNDNPLGIDVDFLDDFINGSSKIFDVIYSYLNDFKYISTIHNLKRAYNKESNWNSVKFVIGKFEDIDNSIGFIVEEVMKLENLSAIELMSVKKFVYYIFSRKLRYLIKAQGVI